MKLYNIPILWESYKRYSVEANTLQEAVEIALKQFLSEPDEEYLEGSFNIDNILEDEYPGETFNLDKIIQKL